MKNSRISIIVSLPLLIICLFAVVYDLKWLVNTSELLIYFILVAGFSKRLNFSNLNIISFIGISIAALVFKFLWKVRFIYFIVMFFQMASYFFLTREAVKYTKRENANKFMLLFFFLMIIANFYFVFGHFRELEGHLASIAEFGFYSMYYINLMVLSITGLIYYLNSYSRKSVYFVSLIMTIVVADILRDMALFYLPDTSVMLLENLLRFGGIVLAFKFFVTEEKKLKLINLV